MNGIIYKITNRINNKVYIGLTTTTLENRWRGHKTSARKAAKNGGKHPLYNAMAKYGIENFTIEQIDTSDNIVTLGNLERKYIKEHNSVDRNFGYNITRGGESNQLDANPRTKLTVDDIKRIRNIYCECKIGPQECWESFFKNKISYSAFEKIYEGKTWTSIMPEVYTLENKEKHRKMCKSLGEKNGNALLTNEEVLKIREYYVSHPLKECYEKYGKNFSSVKSFRCVIDKGYKNVPIYSKSQKKWFEGDSPKRAFKKNDIRVLDDRIEIDTFDDYGSINGTYLTDLEYLNVLTSHKWSKFCNDKIYTQIDGKVTFLHDLITNNNEKRVYYINGNPYDVRRANLTHSLTEDRIIKYGIENFQNLCMDNTVSLREIGRRLQVSVSSLSRYINKNNIPISENKCK